jgi:Ala-tRNA(Pro) deacylase
MIVLQDSKKLDTTTIREIFADSKMSFASEDQMLQKIAHKPWSVSPFALVNNSERDIRLIIDAEIQGKLVGFHPLQNDNTVVLNMIDVEKFLNSLEIEYFFKYL